MRTQAKEKRAAQLKANMAKKSKCCLLPSVFLVFSFIFLSTFVPLPSTDEATREEVEETVESSPAMDEEQATAGKKKSDTESDGDTESDDKDSEKESSDTESDDRFLKLVLLSDFSLKVARFF